MIVKALGQNSLETGNIIKELMGVVEEMVDAIKTGEIPLKIAWKIDFLIFIQRQNLFTGSWGVFIFWIVFFFVFCSLMGVYVYLHSPKSHASQSLPTYTEGTYTGLMRTLYENDPPTVSSSLISPQSANVSETIADKKNNQMSTFKKNSVEKKDCSSSIISHNV